MANPVELMTRLEELPKKAAMKELVGYLAAYNEDLRPEATRLIATTAQCRYAPTAIPNLPLQDAQQARTQATAAAKRLCELLIERVSDVKTDAARNLVVTIREQSKAASTKVQGTWSVAIEQHGQKYRDLADAMNRTGIPGAADLSTASQTVLAHATKPPVSPASAKQVRTDLEVLNLALEKLELPEKARAFLIAVVRGGVPLAQAFDTTVQPMLKKYPQLLQILTIKPR